MTACVLLFPEKTQVKRETEDFQDEPQQAVKQASQQTCQTGKTKEARQQEENHTAYTGEDKIRRQG